MANLMVERWADLAHSTAGKKAASMAGLMAA
jgi:hypothetical protein